MGYGKRGIKQRNSKIEPKFNERKIRFKKHKR